MSTASPFQHSVIEELNEKYGNVSAILKCIKIFYILMILALISDLHAKVVVVEPNVLFIKEYNRKNFGKVRKI